MNKVKFILTAMGLLTVTLTVNGYAMMGGGSGRNSNVHGQTATYHRYDRTPHYYMESRGYSRGNHYNGPDMEARHLSDHMIDGNMGTSTYFRGSHIEFNYRNGSQGNHKNPREIRSRRYGYDR